MHDGICGLFATPDMSGNSRHWELLNGGPNLWSDVTAIDATYDGSTVFVGNSKGQIFMMQPTLNWFAYATTVGR